MYNTPCLADRRALTLAIPWRCVSFRNRIDRQAGDQPDEETNPGQQGRRGGGRCGGGRQGGALRQNGVIVGEEETDLFQGRNLMAECGTRPSPADLHRRGDGVDSGAAVVDDRRET